MASLHVPQDVNDLYEVYDYKHAAAILKHDFPQEFEEICNALRNFKITTEHIKKAGGNESMMPKLLADVLPGWKKEKLTTYFMAKDSHGKEVISSQSSTHIIDFYKDKVALDMEWNSKDQTYDRDLYAFRSFFDIGRIDVGVIVTRGSHLVPLFKSLGSYMKNGKEQRYVSKYGASTTHWGKLIPRLIQGRSGGCPILVFGITDKIVMDYIK